VENGSLVMADGDLGLSTGEYNFGEDRSEARHYWFGDVQILRRCSDAKSFLEEYSGVSCIFARLGQINRFALLWKMGREHRGESASMAVMRKAAQK
jgi:hypothetical protein